MVDKQALFREGVCALLETNKDVEIVGGATNGEEAIEMVREQIPDVVLVDMDLPTMDGAEVTQHIRKKNSDIKVLIFTEYEDRDHILSGLKAGANGYIPKRAAASDLVSAILAVYQGGCFLYPSVAKTVVNEYLHPKSSDPYDQLTHRKKEVLKLIVGGHKSREIANLLHIQPRTAQGHRTSLMKKLGTHNVTELIKYAIRKHLITFEVGD